MSSTISTFRRYTDPEKVKEVVRVLNANGIKTLVSDNSAVFDPTFTNGGRINDNIEVKILSNDFEKATQTLRKEAEKHINEVDDSYFIFNSTEDELYDILLTPDEWSDLDYVLAVKLLRENGKGVNDDVLSALEKRRNEELSKPEKSNRGWIVIGYVLALMGGVIGIFIGWMLAYHKRTLPNGKKVFGYTEGDRNHGKNIFYIGVITSCIYLSFELIDLLLSET